MSKKKKMFLDLRKPESRLEKLEEDNIVDMMKSWNPDKQIIVRYKKIKM